MNDDDVDRPAEPSYKVGYCKPPRHSQFKPGHNMSKGRTKGSRDSRQQQSDAWHSRRPITIDGKRKRLSNSEIGALNMASKGAKADQRAYERQIENEDALALRAEARRQAVSVQQRADRLTMSSIFEKMRAYVSEDGARSAPADNGGPSVNGTASTPPAEDGQLDTNDLA